MSVIYRSSFGLPSMTNSFFFNDKNFFWSIKSWSATKSIYYESWFSFSLLMKYTLSFGMLSSTMSSMLNIIWIPSCWANGPGAA